ncbi:cation-translocating P-type ATPase [Candidatus Woesearchaeota archaeon]|nr:cation-translocating P-type ATPase [Candidatus Woesearchaeota archaeon]
MNGYHDASIEEVCTALKTSRTGIDEKEARFRLKRYGLNKLKEKKTVSKLKIFLEQFKNPVVWVLLGATLVSLAFGEILQSTVILIIVLINAFLGFLQEYKAERTIVALLRLTKLQATIIREGKKQTIDALFLVPGDIIVLETGDKVPADARLIEATTLQANESSLTGESVAVRKTIEALPKETLLADRTNMVYAGTIITSGRALALVTHTGTKTEMGKIAHLLQETSTHETPLQQRLRLLSKRLGFYVLLISAIIFTIGVVRGETALPVLMIAVALAVAAIPEGLPIVVTICLALGVQRMAKQSVLIRKLHAAEALGSISVICTDKTGTLTKNEMTVTKVYANHEEYLVTGSGYERNGSVTTIEGVSVDTRELAMLFTIGAMNNNAEIERDENNTTTEVIGDPTEAALLISAGKAGIDIVATKVNQQRIGEIPFSSERKRMTTIHKIGTRKFAYTKGAPEQVLRICTSIKIGKTVRELTIDDNVKILKQNEAFGKQALRVLAFAYRELRPELEHKTSGQVEGKMVFVGLQAMMDPPRERVSEAVATCHEAGIKVVMVTGDHKDTALAIAQQVGITGSVITGKEIDEREDLASIVDDVGVYARVDPSHKIKIISALQRKGYRVAMTGDGVNDAPALKKADIGIAMGMRGTDVAKEASDIILMDDNFTSIVNGIEEGRGIFDNIKKFVNYLLSSNLAEVLILVIAMFFMFTDGQGWVILPLATLHLLWINVITDGLPALALSVDPKSYALMQRPPRNGEEGIITKNMALNIITVGILVAFVVLGLFAYYLPDAAKARTIAFTAVIVFEMVRIQMIRSHYKLGVFSNRWLLGAICSSLVLQLLVLYTPLQTIFNVVPLGLIDWAIIIGVTIPLFAVAMLASLAIKKVTNQRD